MVLGGERDRVQGIEIKLLGPVTITCLRNLDPIGWEGQSQGGRRGQLCFYKIRIFLGIQDVWNALGV